MESTYGGRVHGFAIIGSAPESREWKPGDRVFYPELGEGVRVEAFVTVDSGLRRRTEIGARTWLMKHVHVGHDAIIEADCELAPGVVIGGHVEIGSGVRIGVGAVVRPFITIGDGARIGCGAVVVKHVPAGEVWAGNPARSLGCNHKWVLEMVREGVSRTQYCERCLVNVIGPVCCSCGEPEHVGAPCVDRSTTSQLLTGR